MKSVEDEMQARQGKDTVVPPTPKVESHQGSPSSPSEEQSDKTWSRAGDDNLEREVKDEGTPTDAGM